jgi:hypothetical protein
MGEKPTLLLPILAEAARILMNKQHLRRRRELVSNYVIYVRWNNLGLKIEWLCAVWCVCAERHGEVFAVN